MSDDLEARVARMLSRPHRALGAPCLFTDDEMIHLIDQYLNRREQFRRAPRRV